MLSAQASAEKSLHCVAHAASDGRVDRPLEVVVLPSLSAPPSSVASIPPETTVAAPMTPTAASCRPVARLMLGRRGAITPDNAVKNMRCKDFGAMDEAAGECTGRAMNILAKRGRSVSVKAAEGFAAFHCHGAIGAIGADALDDLVPRMTAGLPEAAADDAVETADGAVESVGEAITRTYRDKFPAHGVVKG